MVNSTWEWIYVYVHINWMEIVIYWSERQEDSWNHDKKLHNFAFRKDILINFMEEVVSWEPGSISPKQWYALRINWGDGINNQLDASRAIY